MESPARPASLETFRRVAESIIIAVVSSAALYLVGWVYVDAYYGRLALEVIPPDLPPPYVALQAVHALWGLLDYPLTLLIAVGIYLLVAEPTRRPGQWLAQARARFPRLLPILANLIVVFPLLLKASTGLRVRELPHRSVLAEITSVLAYAGVVLLLYVIWLGWRRRYLLAEIRAHQVAPLALVFLVYLLSALVTTGVVAELAAIDLLTGSSPGSVRVTFVTKPGVLPDLAGQELLLVAERNGSYYAVVREPSPPGPWATSYAVPAASVDAVQMRPFQAPAPTAESRQASVAGARYRAHGSSLAPPALAGTCSATSHPPQPTCARAQPPVRRVDTFPPARSLCPARGFRTTNNGLCRASTAPGKAPNLE